MLERAISILREGNPLPCDLIADLLNEGYDVSAIERKYSI